MSVCGAVKGGSQATKGAGDRRENRPAGHNLSVNDINKFCVSGGGGSDSPCVCRATFDTICFATRCLLM
jgi:hypothetical protein